ncbi:hypothetical protein ACU7A6_08395 [Pseudomonas aeruginosa]
MVRIRGSIGDWPVDLTLELDAEVEGPQLLAELEAFSGNAGAAKQLLVRLRHDARVKVEVVDGTQVFVWLED